MILLIIQAQEKGVGSAGGFSGADLLSLSVSDISPQTGSIELREHDFTIEEISEIEDERPLSSASTAFTAEAAENPARPPFSLPWPATTPHALLLTSHPASDAPWFYASGGSCDLCVPSGGM